MSVRERGIRRWRWTKSYEERKERKKGKGRKVVKKANKEKGRKNNKRKNGQK